MKSSSRFVMAWVAALGILVALSLAGCRTGWAWRAGGPRNDPAGISEGVAGDRLCRFG